MKLVVLGAGESGVGTAILANKKGYEVFVSDMGQIQDKYVQALEAHQIDWEECGHTAGRILDADEVVKSPGIPDTAPMVQALLERGIPVLSEIEFAARYTKGHCVCITGSNGKTTTTRLIHYILHARASTRVSPATSAVPSPGRWPMTTRSGTFSSSLPSSSTTCLVSAPPSPC